MLHGVRCLSSRSGSGGGRRVGRRPAEKRQRASAEAKDDAEKEKESYTFLEEEDLGRLSSESKVSQGVESVVFMHNMWIDVLGLPTYLHPPKTTLLL